MKKRKNVGVKLRSKIESLLKEHKQESLTLPQILDALEMQKHDKAILLDEMKTMEKEGLVVKTGGGRYGLPERL
ncbi:MAG: hypothetical protein ACQESO_05915, partial [Bacillota bacterium]